MGAENEHPIVRFMSQHTVHSTPESVSRAAAGLDMTMPGEPAWGDWNNRFFGKTLVEVVESGQLSQERLDDMATRILTSWLLLGQDKNYPEPNLWCWDHQDPRNKHVDVAADHAKLCREIAEASIVLLKNDDGILPLRGSDDLRSIAVLGQGAGDSRDGPSLSGEGGQVEHYIFENGAHLTVIGNRPGWDDYVEQSIDGGGKQSGHWNVSSGNHIARSPSR